MMHLAIITPGLLPVPAVNGGAVETLATYLLEDLAENGVCCDVYTCCSEQLDKISKPGYKICQVRCRKLLRYTCAAVNKTIQVFQKDFVLSPFALKLCLKSWRKYDYILVENSMRIYQWMIKNPSAKNKLLYHMHNDLEGDYGDKSIKRMQLVGKTAKCILTCSNYIENQVKKVTNNQNVYTLYNCIDTQKYSMNTDCRWVKNNYKLKKSDKIVLYCGRLAEEKGVLELAQAMFPILRGDKNIKLFFVGSVWFPDIMESPYMDKVKEVLKEVEKQVIFTGYQDTKVIPAFYEISDIVVIPSIWEEPFGMVALEGMLKKKPIVATNSGGIPEVLDARCAVIVEKDENMITSMTSAIKMLLNDKELAQRMGQCGYELAKDNACYDKQKYGDNFLRLLKKAEMNR